MLDKKPPRNMEVEKVGFFISLFLFLSIINVIFRLGVSASSVRLPAGLFVVALLVLLRSRWNRRHAISLAAGMKRFGQLLNDMVVGLGLFVVYVCGVGLTALSVRLIRKRLLPVSKKGDTYWQQLDLSKQERSAYLDQF